MTRLLGISGSLRRGSFNTALLRAAVELAGEGVTLEAAGIHGIPLYDADLEAAQGLPEAVVSLKDKVADFRILRDARGWARPSDHVPVTAVLEV